MPEPPTAAYGPHDRPTLAGPPTEPAAAADGAACPVVQRFGDYELIKELGRGGMGVVFKARETALNRLVAVKMLLPGALPDDGELRRFQTEAEAAACLQHPNIVSVHRVGVQDGRHYYAMDLIDGPSLAQRLARGPLPGCAAARYMAAIARAIDHAHRHGVLHRDLKPGNILLDADDQPHVADFSLAKRLTAGAGCTRTGSVLGTPSYMAPEQATGAKEVGPACDVYGLGALLYELLTGRPPFRADTPLETILQVLEREPAAPRSLNPRADRDLETICLKCLNKDPAHRYPSAAAVADDLERTLRGESIHAHSLNVIDRLEWALGHSGYDVEFGAYGALLYWFAGIVFVMHVVKQVLISVRGPAVLVGGCQFLQLALMAVVFWRSRKQGVLPTTAAERQLWSVWIGYLIASVLVAFLGLYLFGLDKLYESVDYPFFAVVAGLAFFSLGSSYWGHCYAFGLAFFALAGLMLLSMPWATIEFGLLWTAVLLLIGRRLRKLAKERGEPARAPRPAALAPGKGGDPGAPTAALE
jgi:hypothetical protein